MVRGDPACIAAFYKTYHTGVFRFMLCLAGNADDAEDLAQESLIRARERIRQYRGDAALRTWVHRVAFTTFTHWRRPRRPEALGPDHPSQGRELEQVEVAAALLSALRKLGPQHALPLVLLEVNDMSVEQIADVMGIPAGTVKSRLFVARKRLREYLGGFER